MKIPQTLRKRLREGKVIPFAGAGVSMAVTDQAGKRLFPSWKELLLRAADRLDEEHQTAHAGMVRSYISMGRPKDYLSAAEEAFEALGPVWFRFLKDQLDLPRQQAVDESLALARLVWGLNSNLVVTTNYDNVLRWAHPSGVDVKVWDIQAGAEQADLLQNGVRSPIVWHLHGHIDDAAHLILTPGGYQLRYPWPSESEVQYRAAHHTLRSLLASHSLLIIGFSMDDEQISRQLERMREVIEGASGPHYVLVREGEKERVRSLDLPVEILTYSDFGQPLVDCLAALGRISAHKEDPLHLSPAMKSEEPPRFPKLPVHKARELIRRRMHEFEHLSRRSASVMEIRDWADRTFALMSYGKIAWNEEVHDAHVRLSSLDDNTGIESLSTARVAAASIYNFLEEHLIEINEPSDDAVHVLHTNDDFGGSERSRDHRPRVFIVHGHNEAKKWELKNFLTHLGLHPIILHEQDDQGLTILEKFELYAGQAEFAFVLLTPDDQPRGSEHPSAKPRARQNVIMELGWFMAHLGRERVIILHKGEVEIPSDIYGVLYLPFTNSVLETGEKIRQRLKGAGLLK